MQLDVMAIVFRAIALQETPAKCYAVPDVLWILREALRYAPVQ